MIGHDEQADRVTALEEEVAQLRRAVVSHALVDQAIGVVITAGGLRPEQGWEVLKQVSQHTNVKLREVARCLVQWPAGRRLPEEIRRALSVAVAQARDAPHGSAASAERDGQVPSCRPVA
ncbi:ANTAR domain-containing protein [Streptomyces fodineus]|uniref:ANTAR domain-containing protein n=1 Tax=Streptomyces fodineus TaxID=1904616 RepID=A0A1D7Y3Z6_9ACTN|nr:ANTAR domain-containing protein [Streptomyces fodineus]AOR30170.1 ANTAR domain-containing protein [Streptomyces fodineus]